jgi:hypothetical protein
VTLDVKFRQSVLSRDASPARFRRPASGRRPPRYR